MEDKTIIEEIKTEATNQANIWKFITQSDHKFFEECFVEGAKWMMNKQNKEITELKEKAERYDKLSKYDKFRSILGKPSKWVVKMLRKENDSLELEKQELLDFIKKYYKGTGTDFDKQANELINKYENE